MVGASRSVHCLSRRVGMGSSAHVLEGADAIRSETVLIGTLSNDESSHIFRTELDCVEDVAEGCTIQHCCTYLYLNVLIHP